MPVVDRARLIVWQRHDVWTLVSATFSAPQSPFYHDPKPVGVLCSAHGNLRVFEYTVCEFLLTGSAEQVLHYK